MPSFGKLAFALALFSTLAFSSADSSGSLAEDDSSDTSDTSDTDFDDSYRPRVWQPRVGTQMQMILTGVPDLNVTNSTSPFGPYPFPRPPRVDLHPNVPIFDIDLFDTPASTISLLHRLGKRVVCYFSAGTVESWRPDAADFLPSDIGSPLPLWPGERYVDVRSASVMRVMSQRIALAKSKGCDGIDPDNVDVYSNDNGLNPPLTTDDVVVFVKQLSNVSHASGMAIGLKNAIKLLPNVTNDIQFAVSETCVSDDGGCDVYQNFTVPPREGRGRRRRGKPVFHVEYVNYTSTANSSTVQKRQWVPWSPRPPSPSPPTPGDPVNITSNFVPDLVNEPLRRRLCLEDLGPINSTAGRLGYPLPETAARRLRLSTSIKTLDLDGWVMWCDGRVEKTRTWAGASKNVTAVGNGTVVV